MSLKIFFGVLLIPLFISIQSQAFSPEFNRIAPPCEKSPWKSSKLDKFLNLAKETESTSVVLIKNGCVVTEFYQGANSETRLSIQSVTKSIAALTVGQLISDGKLSSLDLTLAEIFGENSFPQDKSLITIRQLLSQTSGLPEWNEAPARPTIIETIAASPMKFKAGTQFYYSSMASFLLGPIIEKLSGENAAQYISRRVLRPLGIKNEAWSADGSPAIADLGGGLFLTTEDLSRIGLTLLNKGRWQQHQVFNSKWVEQITSSSQTFFPEYGYLFWLYDLNRDSKKYQIFSAVGYQGQYITVDSLTQAIAIRTHDIEYTQDLERLKKIFFDLPPAFIELVRF